MEDLLDVAGWPTTYGNPDWARTHPVAASHAFEVGALDSIPSEIVGRPRHGLHEIEHDPIQLGGRGIGRLHDGRPVLIGTTSVETSERISDLLKRAGVRHSVLNAKFHQREAEIVAEAGRPGVITIATNMAGRGTDIVLGGMEANVGNKSAALIDITTKSGTKPGFGSLQMFGGSNRTVNPSFEYGGTIGEKFRYYILNSHTSTNRGIGGPTGFSREPEPAAALP